MRPRRQEATDSRPERAGGDRTAWRRRRLADAGFGPELADAVARERGFDLHLLIELVERGCPPLLAARILAPLESGKRRC